jgi:hypothetical protein
MSTFEELKRRAAKVAVPRSLSESAQCATVGAAPETHRGDIFVGACIDTWSSLGFCAEHAAAAAMLTAGQNEIKRTVAIHHSGQVLAPADGAASSSPNCPLEPRHPDAGEQHRHGHPARAPSAPLAGGLTLPVLPRAGRLAAALR